MSILRVATYNIHKGVQGLGPVRRLEIHNLAHAVEQFDADIVCLQEVRRHHRKLEKHFTRWPDLEQADYLSPEGYESVYRTNAVTRHGEHGNALLSRWPVLDTRHSDVSDHRFEQRGLLHVHLLIDGREVHVVVVHFGLIHASRERQVQRLGRYVAHEVPVDAPLIVAGDFNDWRGRAHEILEQGAALREVFVQANGSAAKTFPSRFPLLSLDRIYVRNAGVHAPVVLPRKPWSHLSDHAPLVAEIEL
jgi:endonuclease/exonuclease/phosphatase family metal-dependent hydrolase